MEPEILNPKVGRPDIAQAMTRSGYGDALVELGDENPNVVVLTADLTETTRSAAFAKKFPDRFVEVGVAEQNLMGIAAGLALSGKVAFVSSYATFSPGRSWDQARVSVAYSQANVKIAGAHTGVSVGPDGATHQALEDIAIMRVLPNMVVLVPCDYEQTKKATVAAGRYKGPVYLRFTRDASPVFTTEHMSFEIGKAQLLRDGTDVAIIGAGPVLYSALLAAEQLKQEGISVLVLNSHTIKPIDAAAIAEVAKKCGCVVTVEEHQVMGGCGSAVCEVLAKFCPVPVEMVGMQDTFGESGEPGELLAKYGMDTAAIVAATRRALSRKGK
jgi:transketolase